MIMGKKKAKRQEKYIIETQNIKNEQKKTKWQAKKFYRAIHNCCPVSYKPIGMSYLIS